MKRAGPKRLKNYRGVAVYKNPNGTYSPGFDKDSEFDSPTDLRAFIRSWKTNPAKFDKCVREVKASLKKEGRKGNAYAICTKAGTRNPTKKNIIPLSAYDVIAAPDLAQLLDKAGLDLKKAAKSGHGKHRRKNRRNPVKRNSVDAAVREFEATHGRPPDRYTRIATKMHEHDNLVGWGDLERLDVEPLAGGATVKVTGFKGALLAFNEQRKKTPQLFIDGGNQSVDLKAFGIQPPYHESEVLGWVKQVYYFTTKDHLAPEDGGTATYRHSFRFGKRKPMLIYDTVNKLLSFSGGKYTLLDEGIDN